MTPLSPVAVVGAGSWGTAAAALAAANNADVRLWCRRSETADDVNRSRTNSVYLPGIQLPVGVRATASLEEAIGDARVVAMAVPSHAFREVFMAAAPMIDDRTIVVSLTKGVEQGTLKRMTEVIGEEAPTLPRTRIGVLTGPNLAREVASHQPAASVVAMADADAARAVQEAFRTFWFRVYTNSDVVGSEMGGALKNVMAIAAGVAEGLGFGDNAKAALVTRGLAEMTRLGVALGGRPLTFAGLAGMGDLVATCMSKQSRNRYVGEQLGRGRALDDITAEMNMVAEGIKTTRAVVDLAGRLGVDVPIAEHVAMLLYEAADPGQVVLSLMARQAGAESEGLESAVPP